MQNYQHRNRESTGWSAAQTKAAAQGTNLSEVIRRLLTEWLKEGKQE